VRNPRKKSVGSAVEPEGTTPGGRRAIDFAEKSGRGGARCVGKRENQVCFSTRLGEETKKLDLAAATTDREGWEVPGARNR